jgi:DNA-binding MarR family transcriptional regulator
MARNKLKLADYLPYRLSVAAYAVSTLISAAYERRFNLPIPQWRVLAILSEHESMTQQDLVPLSTMDKQMVSRAVRALAARKLIRRRPSLSDGRAYTLSLSQRGRALYGRVVPLALRYERQLVSALKLADARALRATLRRLERAAATLGGKGTAGPSR